MKNLQSSKLVECFNAISESLLEEDVNGTLCAIARGAAEVLRSDLVAIFRYKTSERSFHPEVILSGTCPEGVVEHRPTGFAPSDLLSTILTNGSVFIEIQGDYDRLVGNEATQQKDGFNEVFLGNEQIKSVAALRLKWKNEDVGVMFLGYRNWQRFADSMKTLAKSFASQAARAIAYAILVERERLFWERERGVSYSLSVSEVTAAIAHNSGNLLNQINVSVATFAEYLRKLESKDLEVERAKTFIENLVGPLNGLSTDFAHLNDYRKFDQFKMEMCRIEEIIARSLALVRNSFARRHISIKTSYGSTPEIMVDENQSLL
ncbi:MAG: hypothetical protein ACREAC_31250 [Blastocatellia bacterium]